MDGPDSADSKHEGVAKAIMIAATAPDRCEVRSREREVAYQLTLIRGRIEQRGDLGFGQLLSSHHSCFPVSLRPADQPIQARKSIRVGRVVALEAEVRQTASLWCRCIGSAKATGQGNRDGLPL